MATISINLDDQATQGLQALNSELTHTAEVSDHVAAATANLSEEQSHQITVIQRQEASFKSLASASIPALAQTGTAAIGLGRDILHATHAAEMFAFQMGGEAVKALLRIAETTVKYTVIAGGAATVIRAARGDHESAAAGADQHHASLLRIATTTGVVGAAYLTLTGQWQSGGQAAAVAGSVALKAINGLAAPAAAVAVTLTAYEAILDRTGIKFDEFGERSTNLDRISKRIGDLSTQIGSNVAAGVAGLPEYYSRLLGIGDAWRAIDTSVTRGSVNVVENVGHVRSLVEWMGFAAKSTDEFDKRVKRTTDDFERLRESNKKAADASYSDDIKRAANDATAHAKTLSQIEEEVAAQRIKAGEMARAGSFTAAAQEAYEARINALKERSTELSKAEAEKQKKIESERAEYFATVEREITARQQAEWNQRVTTMREAYDEQRKLVELFSGFERDARFDAVDETLKTVIAKMKEEGASAGDIHHAKLAQINAETNRRIEAAKTVEETLKAAHDGERARMRQEAEFNREMEVQKIKDKKDAAKEVEKLQKEAAAKLAGDIKEAGGPSGQDLLKATDPRQVMKNIQANRGRDAAREFDAANEQKKDDLHWAGDDMGQKRLEAQRRAAIKKAEAEAGRDFRQGKVDPREMAAGQNQAAQQTLGAMQKNGALSGDVVKSLSEATRIAAEQQATLGQLQTQVKQIDNYQKQLLGRAQQQRRQAQNGG